MIVERLTVEHFARLRVQAAQRERVRLFNDPEYLRDICTSGGYAAVADGETVAVAGVIDMGGGRGLAWAWMGEDLPRYRLGVFRAIRAFLKSCTFHRVELHVSAEHPKAATFAERLGFRCETLMQGYFADGRGAYLYARTAWTR